MHLTESTHARETDALFLCGKRQGRTKPLDIILQMLLGTSIEVIEKIVVGYDPNLSKTVNALIKTDTKTIPVFTGVVVLESEFQARTPVAEDEKEALKGLSEKDLESYTV